MVKKVIALCITSVLSTSLYAIDGGKDFVLGWTYAQQNFKNTSALTKEQKGLDLAARLYYYINDDSTFALGFEAGFSHVETHFDIGGNLTRGQFLMKYKLLDYVEVFGGGGLAGRGLPSTVVSNATFGGMVNGGVAYVTEDPKYRFEITAAYYNFSGIQIDTSTVDEIRTYQISAHAGISIE